MRSACHCSRISSTLRPVAHGQSGQIGGSHAPWFPSTLRAYDLRAEQVRLELHQQVVARRAAIDLQLPAAGRPRRVDMAARDVQRLVGDALQRRTGDVRRRRAAADAADGAPGILVPIRGRRAP